MYVTNGYCTQWFIIECNYENYKYNTFVFILQSYSRFPIYRSHDRGMEKFSVYITIRIHGNSGDTLLM